MFLVVNKNKRSIEFAKKLLRGGGGKVITLFVIGGSVVAKII